MTSKDDDWLRQHRQTEAYRKYQEQHPVTVAYAARPTLPQINLRGIIQTAVQDALRANQAEPPPTKTCEAQTRIAKQRSSPDYHQLVISALLAHHRQEADWRGLGCWDPAKQKDILKTLKLPEQHKGRISEVITKLFRSQNAYAQLCRRKSNELLRILQKAAGETAEATGAGDCIDGLSGSDIPLADLLLDRKSS